MKYLHENVFPWNEDASRNAAEKGHLEISKYLCELGYPWDEDICEIASENNFIDILKYARDNECPYGKLTEKWISKNPQFINWLNISDINLEFEILEVPKINIEDFYTKNFVKETKLYNLTYNQIVEFVTRQLSCDDVKLYPFDLYENLENKYQIVYDIIINNLPSDTFYVNFRDYLFISTEKRSNEFSNQIFDYKNLK